MYVQHVPCLWRVSLSPVQDVGDGWWEGQLPNGQPGLFPQAYVEVSGEVCCVRAYVCTYVYMCVLCVCMCMCTFMCVGVGVHVLWYMHARTACTYIGRNM